MAKGQILQHKEAHDDNVPLDPPKIAKGISNFVDIEGSNVHEQHHFTPKI